MSASQPTPQNPVPSGPIGPVTVPRGARTPKRVGLIVLAVAVLMAGLAVGLLSRVRRPADFPPPPALPKVIDDPVVTEAIDLFKKPKLGPSWNASAGAVPRGLRSIPFFTPCGVLVTVVESGTSTDPQLLSQTRIVGYDIATGQQKWSHGLPQVTGLKVPWYSSFLGEDVTYSGDCRMVINFSDQGTGNVGAAASLFIDLANGDLTTIAWTRGEGGSCYAAGTGWVGCTKYYDDVSMAVKLDGSTTPAWTESAASFHDGDLVVAGYIFSDAGYRDPATGRVAFGADVLSGKQTVMYVEPRRPGGYRSGLVLRVSGQLRDGRGQCQISLLDPSTGRDVWPTPGSIGCGNQYSYQWSVAGQALIVTSLVRTPDPTNTAFSLVDGSMLWQRDGRRYAYSGGWDRVSDSDTNGIGLSETYVFLRSSTGSWNDGMAIRIADGVETKLNFIPYRSSPTFTRPLTINARVMAYDIGSSTLTAFAIDADNPNSPPRKAWSIPIRLNVLAQWTFATGGVMYLVSDEEAGLIITPLLSR